MLPSQLPGAAWFARCSSVVPRRYSVVSPAFLREYRVRLRGWCVASAAEGGAWVEVDREELRSTTCQGRHWLSQGLVGRARQRFSDAHARTRRPSTIMLASMKATPHGGSPVGARKHTWERHGWCSSSSSWKLLS
jgi:hypothetical protein